MENITLTHGELKRLLIAFAVIVVAVGLGIAGIFPHWFQEDILSGLTRALNASLSTTALIFYGFYKFAWRSDWVAPLMGKPRVFGVWIGTLRSDYGRADGKPLELPIVFVIRQDYLSIHISSYTRSQEGDSRIEALIRNNRSETTILAYVFELRGLYPGATMRTSGAGELRLQRNGTELSGTYWTNTPTHGALQLRLISRDIANVGRFEDAVSRWPQAASAMGLPGSHESNRPGSEAVIQQI